MDRIEEVKKILNQPVDWVSGDKGDGVFTYLTEPFKRKLAKQINQLYEPQPSRSSYNLGHDEWYEWFIGMLHRKPNIAEKNTIRHLVEARIEALIERLSRLNTCIDDNNELHIKANDWQELKASSTSEVEG